jgi:hypothetical protein
MKVESFRLVGVRCFEDTGHIVASPSLNIFIGQNNSGKSTLLRGLSTWQVHSLNGHDVRPGGQISGLEITLNQIGPQDRLPGDRRPRSRFNRHLGGGRIASDDFASVANDGSGPLFPGNWPENFIIPFFAKRKALALHEEVNAAASQHLDGTFSRLTARIDRVSSPGLESHEYYRSAIEDILGVFSRSIVGRRS